MKMMNSIVILVLLSVLSLSVAFTSFKLSNAHQISSRLSKIQLFFDDKKPSTISKAQLDVLINNDLNILYKASQRKVEDTESVVLSLESLEKSMRLRNKLDEGKTSQETLSYLSGSWRLIFTTGTADTQKKFGRVNYFPLKAIQSFDVETKEISNGIYVGPWTLIKFFGTFDWLEKPRKLVFDFDAIELFNKFKFNLPKGGAANIGRATGLGSENNVELVKQNKKPFFNWISADELVATARGGGGGLALWRRVLPSDTD